MRGRISLGCLKRKNREKVEKKDEKNLERECVWETCIFVRGNSHSNTYPKGCPFFRTHNSHTHSQRLLSRSSSKRERKRIKTSRYLFRYGCFYNIVKEKNWESMQFCGKSFQYQRRSKSNFQDFFGESIYFQIFKNESLQKYTEVFHWIISKITKILSSNFSQFSLFDFRKDTFYGLNIYHDKFILCGLMGSQHAKYLESSHTWVMEREGGRERERERERGIPCMSGREIWLVRMEGRETRVWEGERQIDERER